MGELEVNEETSDKLLYSFSRLIPFGGIVSPEKGQDVLRRKESCYLKYLSPLMRAASWMSLGMIVMHFAWMAQRFVSSKSLTR